MTFVFRIIPQGGGSGEERQDSQIQARLVESGLEGRLQGRLRGVFVHLDVEQVGNLGTGEGNEAHVNSRRQGARGKFLLEGNEEGFQGEAKEVDLWREVIPWCLLEPGVFPGGEEAGVAGLWIVK